MTAGAHPVEELQAVQPRHIVVEDEASFCRHLGFEEFLAGRVDVDDETLDLQRELERVQDRGIVVDDDDFPAAGLRLIDRVGCSLSLAQNTKKMRDGLMWLNETANSRRRWPRRSAP